MSLKDLALFVGAALPHTRSIWGMDHPAGPIIIGWDREVVGHRPDDPPTPFKKAIRIRRGPKAEAERDKARGYVRDLQRIPGYNVRTSVVLANCLNQADFRMSYSYPFCGANDESGAGDQSDG